MKIDLKDLRLKVKGYNPAEAANSLTYIMDSLKQGEAWLILQKMMLGEIERLENLLNTPASGYTNEELIAYARERSEQARQRILLLYLLNLPDNIIKGSAEINGDEVVLDPYEDVLQ